MDTEDVEIITPKQTEMNIVENKIIADSVIPLDVYHGFEYQPSNQHMWVAQNDTTGTAFPFTMSIMGAVFMVIVFIVWCYKSRTRFVASFRSFLDPNLLQANDQNGHNDQENDNDNDDPPPP